MASSRHVRQRRMLQRATHRPAVIVTTQEVTANVTDDHALGDETTVLAGGGEMGVLMRGVDWSKTSLGPVEQWPQSLRSVVGMLLPSRAPIILFWGPTSRFCTTTRIVQCSGPSIRPHSAGRVVKRGVRSGTGCCTTCLPV